MSCKKGNAKEERPKNDRHPDQCNTSVMTTRFLECGNSIGDCLDACQCGCTACESVQKQKGRYEANGFSKFFDGRWVHNDSQCAKKITEKADTYRQEHHHNEKIGWDGKCFSRFFYAAQVNQHDKKNTSYSDHHTIRKQ